jgi:hypothetical protein
METRKFEKGDIVQHFKREITGPEGTLYLYEIIGEAEHTESGERLMVYRALYGDMRMFARPLDMFMSEVDREKYPQIRQKYRFEKYGEK